MPSERLRILYLEDDARDRELVARTLAGEGLACEFSYATTRVEFERALEGGGFDLIFSDFKLPDSSGFAALGTARQRRPEVPFLLISGTMGEEAAVEILQAGATDCVLKDHLRRLAPAVRRALRESELRQTQQQALDALRQSEERFRQLAENIECVFWMANADLSQMLYVSPAYERIWGRSTASLYAEPRSFLEAVHPEDRERVAANLRQKHSIEGTAFEIEYRIQHQDGLVRWVRDRGFPIKNAAGQLQVMVGIAEDITQRKEAERELRSSEEAFRLVWENSIDGMRLTDRGGRIIAVNEAYCRLVQMPRERLLGELFSVIYKPGTADGDTEIYQKRFDAGAILPRWTHRVTLWNGQELELEISSSFLELGERGKTVLCLFRDTTERRRAELLGEVFSQLGQRLSAARTAHEAAQIIVDTADKLIGWDACSCALYSASQDLLPRVLSMDFIEGRRTECPLPAEHMPPTSLARRAINQGGQLLLRTESTDPPPQNLRFGDTSRLSASLMFVPIRNGKEVIGVLSIQSYTPKAYNQHSLDTLQALADHCGGALDRIRAQESLEATQEQLRQVAKMEAIGQLAGGVAHDFNNLLVVMRGNAELLLMKSEQHSAQTQECLKQIIAAAERSANLTRQLLAFSRKQVMRSQPLVLNDVVANLTNMLKRIIGEHIDLQYRYAAALPHVQADPGMMEQVLVNLVVNARDAMPQGGQLQIGTQKVRLNAQYASTHPEARSGEFVCLTVRDNGLGIAPEHLPHIFEPFFTTKAVGHGTGLGLATVYGIVKQHEGWVEVISQPGQGTAFKLFLPAVPAPTGAAAVPSLEAPLPRGTETILLVEDDYAVRLIARRVLESVGYKVHEAGSAREALAFWEGRSAEIALLLTDIVMPESISGRDLADQLRAQKPKLKVVLMSGYSAQVAGKDTNLSHHANTHFLQKPCSSRTLLETVRDCLDE